MMIDDNWFCLQQIILFTEKCFLNLKDAWKPKFIQSVLNSFWWNI